MALNVSSIVSIPTIEMEKRYESITSFLSEHDAVLNTIFQHGWIAGGCVRALLAGEDIRDIDVFFSSEEKQARCVMDLETIGGKTSASNQKFTDVFFKDKPKIQLIKLYFSDPKACLDLFDFTVSMFAMDRSNFYFGPFSLSDLSKKRLAVHKITYPQPSLLRMLRYTNKGYFACKECVNEFIEVLKSANVSSDSAEFYYPIDYGVDWANA